MAKSGEISYLEMLGAEGITHAVNKPFSDDRCGQYMISLGAIRMLLPPPPARILDLGCGTGWTSCLLAKMGYDVVGQDISPDMIHYANVNKQHYQVQNCSFTVSDYEGLNYQDEFDGAVFFDCLHHAIDEDLALRKVAEALKPGGVCITHEPGEGHAKAEASRHAVEKFDVTEKDMPPYHIIDIAKKHGFKSSEVYPFPAHLVELFCFPQHQDAVKRKHKSGWKKIKDYLRGPYRNLARMMDKKDRNGGLVVLTR